TEHHWPTPKNGEITRYSASDQQIHWLGSPRRRNSSTFPTLGRIRPISIEMFRLYSWLILPARERCSWFQCSGRTIALGPTPFTVRRRGLLPTNRPKR